MLVAGQLFAVLLAVATPQATNAHLSKGIQLYNQADYGGALESLTQALDKSGTRREKALVHLYIGLIQVRYGLNKDARVSLGKAVENDEKLRLPKGSPKEAQKLFRQIKGASTPVKPPKEPKRRPKERPPKERPPKDRPPKERPPKDRGDPPVTPPAVEAPPDNGRPLEGPGEPTAEARAPEPVAALSPSPAQGGVTAPPPSPAAGPSTELRPAPAPAPDLTPSVDTTVDTDGGTPVAAIVTGGVGLAAVATGVVMTLVARSTNDEALSEPVALRAQELHDLALQQQTIGFVAMGAGGAALIVAGVLLLVD